MSDRHLRRGAILILALATAACTTAPQSHVLPVPDRAVRAADLVELTALDPGIKLDVRYATANNFLGRAVYPEARVFLQRPAAEALVRVNRALRGEGIGLLVFDGYRPWSVTKIFWDSVSGDKRNFVADPSLGSRHNRGCAVDLSLYDLGTGAAMAMPTDYDEMTTRAYPDYTGGTEAARRHRDRLRAAMAAEGFTVHPREWWHYDYRDWPEYAVLDVPFAAIGR
jgi:D-alanyl-D-alanine dipeptidase